MGQSESYLASSQMLQPAGRHPEFSLKSRTFGVECKKNGAGVNC